MIHLGNLKPAKGAIKHRRRVGRGPGSGRGKTAARGQNGQKSRSGFSRNLHFEGGQMPLVRRIPKRGFTSIFKKEYNLVNLEMLNRLDVSEVTPETLFANRLARKKKLAIKILGQGTLKRKMKIHAHAFSKTAMEKIGKAGGEAVLMKGE